MALSAQTAQPCAEARGHYEVLELDEALASVERELAADPDEPLPCLEVKALALTLQGRLEEAERAFRDLFGAAPDYEVADPSLPPATRDRIETIRETVRPLAAVVTARWLIHESLRFDVLLEGGLRDAIGVRYTSTALPEGEPKIGEVLLAGRAATATISVTPDTEVRSLRVTGQVVNKSSRVLHQFSSEMLLSERPPMREGEGSDILDLWPIWVGAAVVVAAAVVTIVVVAQPTLPDTDGTIGRAPVTP